VKGVSFDVWSTLLNVDVFYKEIAKALSELSGRQENEAFSSIKRAYTAVKNARRRGAIIGEDVISSSTSIFLESLPGLTKYELYWATARAANTVDPKQLLLDGAIETVEELDSNGYQLAVTSNVIFWPGYVTRILLDKAGLGKYFKVQVYADEAKSLKPDAKPFREMLQALRVETGSCVHVGDSPQEDLAGALNAGLAAILVDWGRREIVIDEKLRIAVVGSLREVPGVVKRFLG